MVFLLGGKGTKGGLTVVRDGGFGEEHVALSWHASGDWVDGKADIDAFSAEHGSEFGDGVLCFGDCHSVADDLKILFNQMALCTRNEGRRK